MVIHYTKQSEGMCCVSLAPEQPSPNLLPYDQISYLGFLWLYKFNLSNFSQAAPNFMTRSSQHLPQHLP